MNYLAVYNNLIKKRIDCPLSKDVYGENHHIIPKCMGGSDDFENIVRLSYKEHYIAHACLYKHYKTPSLAYAWFSMCRTSPSSQKRNITSAQYNMAKKNRSEELSIAMQGEGNHFYGKKHSEETKKLISKKTKNRKKSQSEIDNWVEKVAKKPKSKEHRKKLGRKGLAMLQNIHTHEIVRDVKEKYDPNIWVSPRKIKPEKRVNCVHCGLISTGANISRWHNDNCKER